MSPRRPGDVASLVSDNSKILSTLPWRPRHDDLETIVTHALAWERRLSDIQAQEAAAGSQAAG
jgi:UDP-glucose 4-epimerase